MPFALPQLGSSPSASIKVLMDGGTVFLHPSPSPDLPANDPLLRGIVVLNLPKPKRIRSLSVRLVRYVNVCFPDFSYEYGREVQSQVAMSPEKEGRLIELAKGEHSFAFTLMVPSSAAPYERSQYGRVYYRVVATAKGDGLIGSDLTGERDVHIVVNPAADGEMQDLDVRVEGFHPDIGPWGTILTSQHLTVGGLLHVDFFLPSPPRDLQVDSVTASVHSTWTIKSVEYPKLPEQTVRHKKRLFIIDGQHLPEYQSEYDSAPSPAPRHAAVPQESESEPDAEVDERSVSRSPSPTHVRSPTESTSSPMVASTSTPPATSSPLMTATVSPPEPSTSRTTKSPSRRFSIPSPVARGAQFIIGAGGSRAKTNTSASARTPSSSPPRQTPPLPSPPQDTPSTASASTAATSSTARGRSNSALHLSIPAIRRPFSNNSGLPSLPTPVSPNYLQRIPARRAYQLSHLAQLPGDEYLRPSTIKGTKTPIKVSHEIVLEVRFRSTGGTPPVTSAVASSSAMQRSPSSEDDTDPEGGSPDESAPDGDFSDSLADPNKVRVLRIERPVVISSCCCMLESVLVPTYSETPEPPRPLTANPFSGPRARSGSFVVGPTSSSLAAGIANSSLGTFADDVMCACRCGRPGSTSLAVEQRILAARLRDVAGRDASTEGEAYKAVYHPMPVAVGGGP
ncbi:hypothetical protein DL93DRAFT_2088997 [Clavulina sp. PMI_390]|nr:hypothetical protein DL93DRAFT_2088997 [Clavulina sp. PMI_390]